MGNRRDDEDVGRCHCESVIIIGGRSNHKGHFDFGDDEDAGIDKIKMAAVSGGRGCSLRSRACEVLLVYEKFAGTGRLHLTCLYHRVKYIARKNSKEDFPWTRKWF